MFGQGSRAASRRRTALGTISFVGTTTTTQGNNTAQAMTLPATIAANDIILIFSGVVNGGTDYTYSSTTAGFTQTAVWDDVLSTTGIQGTIFWKRAAGTEGGTSFSTTLSTISKYAMIAAVYRGCKTTGTPFTLFTGNDGTGSVTAHTAPTTGALSPSSWVAEWYSIRSSTNTTYSTPAGTTLRGSVFGSGGGASDGLLVDTNGNVASGGGDTTNSNASFPSSRGVSCAVALIR